MRLGKLSFPIQVSAQEVTDQIRELLEEKDWSDFEIQKPELWFEPFWVFHYNAFSETADEGGIKSTSEGEQGVLALSAQSLELDETVGSLFDEFETQLVVKPSVESFKVNRFRVQKDEAAKLAQLKVAAKLSTSKEDIVISGLKAVFLPVWVTSATFEDQTMEFQIDAVQGNVLSEEEVPERGKTATELAGETFSDLSNPINWIHYLVGLIKTVLFFLWDNPVSKWVRNQLGTNPRFQIAVLAVIIVLILLNEFGFISITLPKIGLPFAQQP